MHVNKKAFFINRAYPLLQKDKNGRRVVNPGHSGNDLGIYRTLPPNHISVYKA
jgi:hypothetical protein